MTMEMRRKVSTATLISRHDPRSANLEAQHWPEPRRGRGRVLCISCLAVFVPFSHYELSERTTVLEFWRYLDSRDSFTMRLSR